MQCIRYGGCLRDCFIILVVYIHFRKVVSVDLPHSHVCHHSVFASGISRLCLFCFWYCFFYKNMYDYCCLVCQPFPLCWSLLMRASVKNLYIPYKRNHVFFFFFFLNALFCFSSQAGRFQPCYLLHSRRVAVFRVARGSRCSLKLWILNS